MSKFAMKDFTDGLEMILRHDDLKVVTVFCSPTADVKQRVRISRPQYNRMNDIRSRGTLIVSYGKPNYAEREFLKLCKKAKCKPRRLWFKFRPKKK